MKNTITGTITGSALNLMQLLFPFFIRSVFIKTLGIDYLGLNGLFASVLQVLNLAELGVSSALVFSMYRPIAEDNTTKICELINLYRLYYRIIGAVVLALGIILIPVLPYLIKGDVPADINLYVIYMMNLAATVLSYWLFAYRGALFLAHQRLDVVNMVSFAVNAVVYLSQIMCLLVLGNYYVYLAIAIAGPVIINLVTALISKRFYPQYVPAGSLPKEERNVINKKMKDLLTAKIGGVVNTSADAIVISAFLGLEIVAIYQNYYYVVTALMSFFTIFFSSVMAGIGNSLIVYDGEENRKLLYNLNHLIFFALNFCCPCLVCLFQPFMKLWVGEKYQLGFEYVVLFALYLFVQIGPRTMLYFKDAGGIWHEDRFRPLVTGLANLFLNLILVNIIGLYGVLLSTILTFLIIALPWLIINIDKYLFKLNKTQYVIRYLGYTTVTAFSSFLCFEICEHLPKMRGLMELVIRLFICAVVSTIIFIVFYGRKEETKRVVFMFKNVGKKKG